MQLPKVPNTSVSLMDFVGGRTVKTTQQEEIIHWQRKAKNIQKPLKKSILQKLTQFKKQSHQQKKQTSLNLMHLQKLHIVQDQIQRKLTNNYVEQQFFQTELVKLNVYQYSQKVKKLKKLKQLVQTTLVIANQLKKSKVDGLSLTLSQLHLT